MHTFYLIILILITASSCKEHKKAEQTLAAQTTAVRVRDSWKEAAKPLTIHIEGRNTDELKVEKSRAFTPRWRVALTPCGEIVLTL